MKDEEIMEGKLLVRKKDTHYDTDDISIPPIENDNIDTKQEIKVIATVVLLILGAFLILTSFPSKEYIYIEETETYVTEDVTLIDAEYYVYYEILESIKGDEFEIEYSVTSGESIEVLIFDDKNKLDEWASGGSTDAIYETTRSKDTLDYILISDGDIYITFYNNNAETIELTVSLEDKTNSNVKYKSLILGGIFCIVGIRILLRQDKLK